MDCPLGFFLTNILKQKRFSPSTLIALIDYTKGDQLYDESRRNKMVKASSSTTRANKYLGIAIDVSRIYFVYNKFL